MKELGSVATASLRVVFFETGKRIAHRIEVAEQFEHKGVAGVDRKEPPAFKTGGSAALDPSHPMAQLSNCPATDNAWQPVLVSCEGIDQEPWPTSPALQSLHIERHGSDDIAFLVGMAGRSHWSASVRANQTLDRIEFEIACRVAAPPRWLGGTYELLDPMNQALQINATEPALTAIENNKWTLTVALADGPTPRTIAWGYTAAVR